MRQVTRLPVSAIAFGVMSLVGMGSMLLLSGCDGGTQAPVAQPGSAPETPAPAGFDYTKAMEGQSKEAAKPKEAPKPKEAAKPK